MKQIKLINVMLSNTTFTSLVNTCHTFPSYWSSSGT